jgi:DNA repair protein RadD
MSDTSNLHLRGGEFIPAEVEDLFLATVESQVNEIVALGAHRKKWLIFCSSVKHCEIVVDLLSQRGITAASVTQKTKNRDAILRAYKKGQYQAIVNCDVLTTGFDEPQVDLLAMLRATQSCGLYVQIVGRGMRPCEGKENCLFLDFGENVERHGCIDDLSPTFKRSKNEKAPLKQCKACACYNKLTATQCAVCLVPFMHTCLKCDHKIPLLAWQEIEKCPACGAVATDRNPANAIASNVDVMSYGSDGKNSDWLPIEDVSYSLHQKHGKPDSVRVAIEVDIKKRDLLKVNKFLCLEHGGFATKQATKYVYQACPAKDRNVFLEVDTSKHLLEKMELLKKPSFIRIRRADTGYYEIVDLKFPTDDEFCKPETDELFEMYGLNI